MARDTRQAGRFVGVRTVDGIKTVNTYGFARNAKDEIEQVYSTVQNKRTVSQEWTGVVYPTERAACEESARLNDAAVRA